MSVEVWTTVEGALESSATWADELADEQARAAAVDLAAAAAAGDFTSWAVYMLPHYCDDADECTCAQWLQDHSPTFSSETWDLDGMDRRYVR
jgi:hypothetical protein